MSAASVTKKLVTRLTLLCLVTTHGPGVADPNSEGIAAGQAANPFVQANINVPAASANVPGYTATPPQSTYYGQGNLTSQANALLANCATILNDPVCQAQVGAMASAHTPIPAVTGTDPSVTGASNVAQNPSLTLGDLSVYYAGCTLAAGTTASSCPPNVYCLGSSCFNTSYAADADFANAMSLMEAAREAGVYLDTTNMQVFEGEAGSCRQRLLKNCCYSNSAGAGMSNQSLFGIGSRLVFDILMNSDDRHFIYDGMRALLTGAGFDGSFTTYGVTLAVNGTALPAGSLTVASSDSFVIAVDPWTLAIAVVVYIVISLSSCNQNEGMLALREGAGLCHTVGTYCSSCLRILGHCVSCIEHTTGKCCFNSLLSRLINEQGRVQIGKGWGSGESPDCSGLTIPQLQSLNFAAMDLSAFYASISPTLPNVNAIQTNNAAAASTCYYGQGQCQ